MYAIHYTFASKYTILQSVQCTLGRTQFGGKMLFCIIVNVGVMEQRA